MIRIKKVDKIINMQYYFVGLRKMNEVNKMSKEKELYLTQEGLDELRKELDELKAKK